MKIPSATTNPVVAAARAAALRRTREAREDQIERHSDGRMQHLQDGKLRWMSKTSFHGSGWVFSIHDVAIRAGRLRKFTHESVEATHRVFVMADGARWVYTFEAGEARALEAPALELQLDDATYVSGDRERANPR